MALISSANPPKRERIPGLLDSNIMVLIHTLNSFESNDIPIVDFADDFLTLNRLHGKVISRCGIDFYWSCGVCGASKHGDPRPDLLLRQVSHLDMFWENAKEIYSNQLPQMKSRPFEKYLASLDETRNGKAIKKELGNKSRKKAGLWNSNQIQMLLQTKMEPLKVWMLTLGTYLRR